VASYNVLLYKWSLPSKTQTTLTSPSGPEDVWWWGISEADSTIVAGVGQRDEQDTLPSSYSESMASPIVDAGTGCVVEWMQSNFTTTLETRPTTDACQQMSEAAIYGGGSIAASRVMRKRAARILAKYQQAMAIRHPPKVRLRAFKRAAARIVNGVLQVPEGRSIKPRS
jgi:hypothetical protein